jgi:hypothetical protein
VCVNAKKEKAKLVKRCVFSVSKKDIDIICTPFQTKRSLFFASDVVFVFKKGSCDDIE